MPEITSDGRMPFLDHIRELRRRLIVSAVFLVLGGVLGFILRDYYLEALFKPLGNLKNFSYHSHEEPFMILLQISFYFGIVISIPVHLYNVIAFILPAMTSRERKIGTFLLPASTVLALAGAALAYIYVVPWAIQFLTSFNPLGIAKVFRLSRGLDMIVKTLLIFMILLQTPLLLIILMALNIVSRRTLLKLGRYAIVGIFILSAIVTPPDILSQVALAAPLIILYYLAIVVALIFGFGKSAVNTE